MAKFQAIICHRSFVEIKMLWHPLVRAPICSRGYSWKVWKGKPQKVTTSGRKRRSIRKIERHVNLTWSGWPICEWLDYDESNDIITCKIWQRWWWWWLLVLWRLAWWSWKLGLHTLYMNMQENKILHLNCINLFWPNVQWSQRYLWNDCKMYMYANTQKNEYWTCWSFNQLSSDMSQRRI